MRARAVVRRAAAAGLAAAAAIALSACVQTRPAERLWPDDPLDGFGDQWVPEPFTAENAEAFDDVIEIERGYVEATAATVIVNLDPDDPIAVHYVDRSDSRQLVRIDAGGSLAVAALPRRILSVRRVDG
jgi:hypothetical protein